MKARPSNIRGKIISNIEFCTPTIQSSMGLKLSLDLHSVKISSYHVPFLRRLLEKVLHQNKGVNLNEKAWDPENRRPHEEM